MTQEGTASNHLVTKAYVDNHNSNNYLKRDGSNFMTGDLNMNEQKVINMFDPVDEQDGVNKRFLEAQLHDYLKTDGQNPMTFDLNMATNKIKNLGTPTTHENDAAINVGFFNSELNASNQNLSTQLTAAYKKYVNESHVTPSGNLGENVFRYLMEDVDESSSENNIEVIGIVSYGASIHQMNKKAYQLSLVKDSGSNNYRSRIGFNLGSLPIGYYTFVCEFFPPDMTNVSVTVLGTTISINNQTTKTFTTYTKTLVQFHRWNSTPPQFIYLDLHGSAPSNNGSK